MDKIGLMVGAAVLLAGAVAGWWWRRTDGRMRPVAQPSEGELLTSLGVEPGRAALVQFSSEFCADCRRAFRVGTELAAETPGLQHLEVDAGEHLEAARALDIWRTPTVLVVGADGNVMWRAVGVPKRPDLALVLSRT
jgi:thiol-disulfide isomerase/thioredoxin